jgi:hypothetical protein
MANENTSTTRYLLRTLILGILLGLIMYATHILIAVFRAN